MRLSPDQRAPGRAPAFRAQTAACPLSSRGSSGSGPRAAISTMCWLRSHLRNDRQFVDSVERRWRGKRLEPARAQQQRQPRVGIADLLSESHVDDHRHRAPLGPQRPNPVGWLDRRGKRHACSRTGSLARRRSAAILRSLGTRSWPCGSPMSVKPRNRIKRSGCSSKIPQRRAARR